MIRKNTKTVTVGNVKIGGTNPVSVQSMTNTDTRDVNSTVAQIKKLEDAGCDIIRVAVPDMDAAKAIDKIKTRINIPLVADIHFDYKLALECLENGIDKVRINPGNIGAEYKVKEVVRKAQERNVPIRIGVNGGSLDKDILAKYGGITPEALVESAKTHVEILEKYDFTDIVISIKASDVNKTFDTYKLASEKFAYPLHLGVTESGTLNNGIIKSSIGIGSLLLMGIGDTIRVSLTADPVNEVTSGISILKSVGLRKEGIRLVSCPTCGRTEIDLIKIVNEVEEKLSNVNKNLKVAVMGCVVNGPGEARDADIGVAGGKGEGLIFKKGRIVKKVSEDRIVDELLNEIDKM